MGLTGKREDNRSGRARAWELIASAKPPNLAKGKASQAMNRIVIVGVRVGRALLLSRKCHWE